MKVLVINQYAGNKGDRAVAYFVMRELRRNGITDATLSTHDRSFWPNAKDFFGAQVRLVPWAWSSERPQSVLRWLAARGRQTRFRYALQCAESLYLRGLKGTGIRRFLCNREFYRELKRADIVISTGGHHVTTRFAPEARAWMYLDMTIALLCKKPMALWSQTIGPLVFKEQKSRAFVKKLLSSCSDIVVRERESLRVLKELGLELDNVHETFDSVFGLNDELTAYVVPSGRQPIVGIAVYNAENRSDEEYDYYVCQMAKIVDGIVTMGLTPRFFPHELKGATIDDRTCIQDIMNKARHGEVCEVLQEDLDPVAHFREVAACRAFIGHKTHSVVFALAVGTPLLALAYHPKTVQFMEQYGLAEFCIQDDELNAAAALNVLQRLCDIADSIGEKQLARSRIVGAKVRQDFKDMLVRLRAIGDPPNNDVKTVQSDSFCNIY